MKNPMRSPFGNATRTIFRDRYGDLRIGWSFAAGALVCVVLVAGVITTINVFARRYEENGCSGYSEATGRPTKFASYSWWNYECLVQLSDGRWVNKDGGSRLETSD